MAEVLEGGSGSQRSRDTDAALGPVSGGVCPQEAPSHGADDDAREHMQSDDAFLQRRQRHDAGTAMNLRPQGPSEPPALSRAPAGADDSIKDDPYDIHITNYHIVMLLFKAFIVGLCVVLKHYPRSIAELHRPLDHPSPYIVAGTSALVVGFSSLCLALTSRSQAKAAIALRTGVCVLATAVTMLVMAADWSLSPRNGKAERVPLLAMLCW
jgi:hypothetical protein